MRSFIDFCWMLVAYAAMYVERGIAATQRALRPLAVAFARSVGLLAINRAEFERAFRHAAESERRLRRNQSIHGARARHRSARNLRVFLRGAWPVYEKYLGIGPRGTK